MFEPRRGRGGRSGSLVVVAALAASLPGCAWLKAGPPAEVRVVDTACVWSRAIWPTEQDWDVISDELVRQISNHNETGAVRCGWKPAE